MGTCSLNTYTLDTYTLDTYTLDTYILDTYIYIFFYDYLRSLIPTPDRARAVKIAQVQNTRVQNILKSHKITGEIYTYVQDY